MIIKWYAWKVETQTFIRSYSSMNCLHLTLSGLALVQDLNISSANSISHGLPVVLGEWRNKESRPLAQAH